MDLRVVAFDIYGTVGPGTELCLCRIVELHLVLVANCVCVVLLSTLLQDVVQIL